MNATAEFQPGSIIRARGREWIVLPQTEGKTLYLRTLGGTEEDVTVIYAPLERLPIEPATFPLPKAEHARESSQVAGLLLRDALMLKLRAGAGPFRSLGKIAVEPRAYQLVPLLMALKQETIRLLIADDVGIGKTIEAGLIAREMLDRGEIQQFTVLCPPHLCEQWQEELSRRFNIQAEIVTTGTAARLERGLPVNTSIFREYPFTVVSLDYIKQSRRRDEFQNSCPDFVIVDEAHTCTQSTSKGRHQRFNLLCSLADNANRHLVLLTATPHSGNEEAYFNLLGLLNKEFVALAQVTDRDHPLYKKLGEHLVQRRRPDIKEWHDATVFPERFSKESTYNLSGEWGSLFQAVLDYARDLIRATESESKLQQRLNWWAALALLRCISSSPAAAVRTLQTRLEVAQGESLLSIEQVLDEIDDLAVASVLDGSSDEGLSLDDLEPGSVTRDNAGQLANLLAQAESLKGKKDPKLNRLIDDLKILTEEKHKPVIFCRYIATAKYLAGELQKPFKNYEVVAITGEMTPGEREQKIESLKELENPAILVATDCLSEGINLQDQFDSVIHYDLSWNPTRHEQREGRVDRFGQQAKKVKTVMLYGADNPIDGAVLQVIIRKAENIKKALGIAVPMPEDENKITQAIMQTVLLTKKETSGLRQLGLDFGYDELEEIDKDLETKWESARDKAKKNQTIFAQRALKPEQVLPEWERAFQLLGNHDDVSRFVQQACRQLNAPLENTKGCYRLPFDHLPLTIRERLQRQGYDKLKHIDFNYPTANKAEHIHRSHPFVTALADYITEEAMKGEQVNLVARAGAVFTEQVSVRTTILLLRMRARMSITHQKDTREMLAEEAIAVSVEGNKQPKLLDTQELMPLMRAKVSKNMRPEIRERHVATALEQYKSWESQLNDIAMDRAKILLTDHRRVRDAAQSKGRYDVKPQLPVDVMGIYILLPAQTL